MKCLSLHVVEAPENGMGDKLPKFRLPDGSFAVAVPNQRQFARHLAALGSTAHLETEEDKYAKTKGDPTSLDPSDAPKAVKVIEKLLDKHFCPLCKNPMVNSVTVECCLAGFCDKCIRKYLMAIDTPQCPICVSDEISVETLKANYKVQQEIDDYLDVNQGDRPAGQVLPTKPTPVAMSASVDGAGESFGLVVVGASFFDVYLVSRVLFLVSKFFFYVWCRVHSKREKVDRPAPVHGNCCVKT